MTSRGLALKISHKWDYSLLIGDIDFINLDNRIGNELARYKDQYLSIIQDTKSRNTYVTSKGILHKFVTYLDKNGISMIDEIKSSHISNYLAAQNISGKTKRNHLGIISRMLQQATFDEHIQINPALHVIKPKMIKNKDLHRLLAIEDLEIIFHNAGLWHNFFAFLYYTGLRASDVAMMKYEYIDRKDESITCNVHKSRKIYKFPLNKVLLDLIPVGTGPIFPSLYCKNEVTRNGMLSKPRKYLQRILKENGREKATLHSFRHAFNNTLRDMGLSIEDRQVLLAHAASETTKIYTHGNFELARKWVNKMPVLAKSGPKVKNKRDHIVTKSTTKGHI